MGWLKSIPLKRWAIISSLFIVSVFAILSFQNFGTINLQTCSTYTGGWIQIHELAYSKAFSTTAGVQFEGHLDSLQISNINSPTGETVYVMGHGDSGVLARLTDPSKNKIFFALRIPASAPDSGTISDPLVNTIDSVPQFFQNAVVDHNGNVFATGFAGSSQWRSRVLFSNPNINPRDKWFENPNITSLAGHAEPSDSRSTISTLFTESFDGDHFMAIRSQLSTPQAVSVFRRKNTDGTWTKFTSKDFNNAVQLSLFFRDASRNIFTFVNDSTLASETARAFRVNPNTAPVTITDMTSFNNAANLPTAKFKILDGMYDNFNSRDQLILVGLTRSFPTAQTTLQSAIQSATLYVNKTFKNEPSAWLPVSFNLVQGKNSKFLRIGRDKQGFLYAFGNGFNATNQLINFVISSVDEGQTWSQPFIGTGLPASGCDSNGFCKQVPLLNGSVVDVTILKEGVAFSSASGALVSVAELTSNMFFEQNLNVTPLSIIADQKGQLWAMTDFPKSTVSLTAGSDKKLKVFKLPCSSLGEPAHWPPPQPWPESIPAIPSKPAIFKDQETDKSVSLKWNHTGGALFYKVKRQKAGDIGFTELPITSLPASVSAPTPPIYSDKAVVNNVITFTDSSLTNQTNYSYKVYGVNPDGTIGPESDPLVLFPNIPVPATPGLSLVPGDGRITISIGGVSFASLYEIEFKFPASSTAFTNSINTSATTFVHTGLTNGLSYTYRVRAKNTENEFSNYSVERTETPQAPTPTPTPPLKPAPPNMTAVAENFTPTVSLPRVTVNWANLNGHSGYRVYRRESTETTPVPIANAPGTPHNDTTVIGGKTYFYSISSIFNSPTLGNVEGDRSGENSIAVPTPTPATPTSVQIASQTTSQIRVTWSPAPNAQSYKVFRSEGAGSKVLVKPTGGEGPYTGLEYLDSQVGMGISYKYCVTSLLNGLESPCSSPDASATLPTPAPTPVQGSCIVASEDLAASMPPGFFAPSTGSGYQKSNLMSGNLTELNTFCNTGVYEQLMAEYCRVNSKPTQWCAAVYFSDGTQGGTNCKVIKADITEKHTCGQAVISSSVGVDADRFDLSKKRKKEFVSGSPTCGTIGRNNGDGGKPPLGVVSLFALPLIFGMFVRFRVGGLI